MGSVTTTDRQALDRERVARIALELLDEVGLDELTMRRLAERLGVTAASLYWHVRDKGELLEMLAEAISAEIPVPEPDRPWRQELRRLAVEARGVILSHRDAPRILVGTRPGGSRRLHTIDRLSELLRRAGFGDEDVVEAGYLLNVYLTGATLDEVMSPSGPALTAATASTGRTWPDGGTLELAGGAQNVTLVGERAMRDVCRVAHRGRAPDVEVGEGTVRVRQRRGRGTGATIALDASVPWAVDVEGGIARLDADLRHLDLRRVHVAGGASDVTLRLGTPRGTVPIEITRGVQRLHLDRPGDARVSVHLRRGASDVVLDGARLPSVGGGMRWESGAGEDRFLLEVGGGAATLTVATAGDAPDPFALAPPDEFPTIAALAPLLARRDPDRTFEFGLDVLLDGLERRLAG